MRRFAQPGLQFRVDREIDAIDQVHGTQGPGIEDQEQTQGKVEQAEGRFQAAQRMGPGHQVVLAQHKVRAGEKGADRGADQENAHRAVDEEKEFKGLRPQQVAGLGTVLVADRLEDEGEENQDPDPVGPAEGRWHRTSGRRRTAPRRTGPGW